MLSILDRSLDYSACILPANWRGILSIAIQSNNSFDK